MFKSKFQLTNYINLLPLHCLDTVTMVELELEDSNCINHYKFYYEIFSGLEVQDWD